jgi:hypothetical protein
MSKKNTLENMFPHASFPYRVEHKDKNDTRICWFSHPSHVQKYLDRSKLDVSMCKIDTHPDYTPVELQGSKKKTKKQDLFASVDTYVKITDKPAPRKKAAPAAPRSASKTPAKTRKSAATTGTAKPRTASPRSKKK